MGLTELPPLGSVVTHNLIRGHPRYLLLVEGNFEVKFKSHLYGFWSDHEDGSKPNYTWMTNAPLENCSIFSTMEDDILWD